MVEAGSRSVRHQRGGGPLACNDWRPQVFRGERQKEDRRFQGIGRRRGDVNQIIADSLLTAFHQHQRDGKKVMEQTVLFRSRDGGKTRSEPEKLDLLGREPYLTALPNVKNSGYEMDSNSFRTWSRRAGPCCGSCNANSKNA